MNRAKQSKKKQTNKQTNKQKKNPSGTRVYETQVPLGKTEQNRAISR